MSLACSNLFGEMSKRGHLKDLCREKHYMKIGTEERIECKQVEWPLPSPQWHKVQCQVHSY